MSPRIGRVRFRTAAGGSSGGSTGGTALVYDGTGMPEFTVDTFQYIFNEPETDPATGPSWGNTATVDGHTVPANQQITATNPKGPWKHVSDTWHLGSSRGSQVSTAAAKDSVGRGFKRFITRNLAASSGSGVNAGSCPLKLDFTSTSFSTPGPYTEFWFQWWERWSTGTTMHASTSDTNGNGAPSYVKNIDFNNDGGNAGLIRVLTGFDSGNRWRIQAVVGGTIVDSTTWGWRLAQGGQDNGGGNWNKYQIHLKMNTPVGTSNGIGEFWANDVLHISSTGFVFNNNSSAPTAWSGTWLVTNQASAGLDAVDPHVDIANVKVSIAGYITQD